MRRSPPHDVVHDRDSLMNEGSAAAAKIPRDIAMYGLKVRTEIALPDWPDPPSGEPQVEIVAEPGLEADQEGPAFSGRMLYSEEEVRVEVRRVGRFTVSGGTRIGVAQEEGALPEDVRLYLTGVIFGLLLHQRSVFPLHASCVAMDGTGVAFAAPSGSGKSTLVAASLRRGASFVTDDICALEPQATGPWRVWPGAIRVKLDPAGMAALDHAEEGAEPAGGERGKYHVRVAAPPDRSSAVPLSRVYLLAFDDGEPRLERLSDLEAISALVDETFVLSSAVAMGLSARIFRNATALSRTLVVSRLYRPRGFEHMDGVLDLIERDVRQGNGEIRSRRKRILDPHSASDAL